ncbi:Fe-S cluster assembly sulfur transfer protein SufU [Roseomonas sp. CAU 1739]|uniref:Fe-S cluster assembly sulfur transfer protein SufU n=1 Tax=Roseomonas sp. CAU 1739 TaxID=3140364 RepID=UPI00325A6EC0
MSDFFGDVTELYGEIVKDHGGRPRNRRKIDDADLAARGDNPMCGDRIALYLKTDGQRRICDAAFVGNGCMHSLASASLMTEVLKGKSFTEARELSDKVRTYVMTGQCPHCEGGLQEDLERFAPFEKIHNAPVRVKCVTLAWHTLNAALDGTKEASSE